MSQLFAPLKLRKLTIRNRIVMAPMSQNSATEDGEPTVWHLVHYGSRAVGGCGLILLEDTAVEPVGRVSSKGLGLYSDAQVAAVAPLVSFCQDQGAAVGVQLAHAGRKAFRDSLGVGHDLIAPSAVPFDEGWQPPRALETDELPGIVTAFGEAAHRAAAAGFDTIEIHAAHGYLLHQFLSPLTNTRDDVYGGSAHARRRLLHEVLEEVRSLWPAHLPVMLRLPASDGLQGGLTSRDVFNLASDLPTNSVDLIDIAAGNIGPLARPASRSQQHRLAAKMRTDLSVSIAVGGSGTGEAAERLVGEGACDAVAVGRPLLRNPYWAYQAAEEVGGAALPPTQYKLAFQTR